MDGSSNAIYILMPIVAIICLAILVVLPFLGDRESAERRSGRAHSLGQQAQGQVLGHPAATGSDAIDPGQV